jgi:hypothetical protein
MQNIVAALVSSVSRPEGVSAWGMKGPVPAEVGTLEQHPVLRKDSLPAAVCGVAAGGHPFLTRKSGNL